MISTFTTLFQICILFAVTPEIKVVYPRPMHADTISYIACVDTNFIFGSVQPAGAKLAINGQPVEIMENGAYLAFLPVDWDNKRYDLLAVHEGDSTGYLLPFDIRPPPAPLDTPDVSFPRLIELTGGAIRNHPRGTYYLFPEPGTVVITDGWLKGYYRIPVAADRTMWAPQWKVRDIGPAEELEAEVVWEAIVEAVGEKWVRLRLPVGRKVLFRIREETDPDRIIIELFNVVSHLDKIAFNPGTDPVRDVTWDKPSDDVFRLEVFLTQPSWGYRVDWENGDFLLWIRRPPELRRGVKGLHIGIDPGHGGEDDGAIGPTGLKEKEANLRAAIVLANLLEDKGAVVTMTRSDDRYPGLRERIDIAMDAETDILISLHHNALADGRNPFAELGTGTYYYRPQSRALAMCIQSELARRLHFPDEGVYYNDLALVRPTGMLAVLIEAAYIILPEQEAVMLEDGYSDKLAKAVYKGLCKFTKLCRRK